MNTDQLLTKTKRYVPLTLLYVSGPVFFLLTDPHNLPLPLLVLPFLWLFTVIFVTAHKILGLRKDISGRKLVIVAGVIATIPVLLALFQSIHQLSLKDVLISTGIVLFAAWYLMRADFIR